MKTKIECPCGKILYVFPSRIGRKKYCSNECKYKNFGLKFSLSNNPKWKGDNIKYGSLHDFIAYNLGKSQNCSHCKTDNLTGHKIHWANISGKYHRDLKDWIRLCAKCHSKYDHSKGRYPEPWNKTNVKIKCKFCKKQIRIKPHLVETKKFCSLICYKLNRKNDSTRKI